MSERIKLIKDFYKQWKVLAIPFWKTKERYKVGVYLLIALACDLINVYTTARLSDWSRDFFNSLQSRNLEEFMTQLGILCILASVSLILFANQKFFCSKAILIWRRWLSAHYVNRWLSSKCYYRETGLGNLDNPDQRIAQDLQLFPALTINMIFDFIDSIGSLGVFSVILWKLSNQYIILGYHVPGSLLWIAIAFVIVGTYFTHLIGKPLINLEKQSQKIEADYRYGLMRIRDNAKAIGAYGGELYEEKSLSEKFKHVYTVWINMYIKRRHMNYFHSGYTQLSAYVPYIVAAPQYFAGAFQMGEIMQTVQAFGGVRVALSWFIFNYSSLAEWKATVDRLIQFENAIRKSEGQKNFIVKESDEEKLLLKDIELILPDGKKLAYIPKLEINKGEHVALSGPSNAGKSTLLYTIKGLWGYGKGTIEKPKGKAIFLSQNPYLPIGTIAQVLTYPDEKLKLQDKDVLHALEKVKLDHLKGKIHEFNNWELILSGGEQQRLALARIWVQNPDWVYMDESLSATDIECRNEILKNIEKDFPNITIFAIHHDEKVNPFYDRDLKWEELNRKN
ncbi:ABC transporter ATP-binding protein/permease [Dialister micraerophilus]|uniref:ABC transporter ATP-binding protein/permease n=1 Tax=Dialister micraerophilus TaxID=309120 RepID=UPI0023F0E611|nr:ABC transporter ATP-binding protein/permease [Dialister micraerophilus]